MVDCSSLDLYRFTVHWSISSLLLVLCTTRNPKVGNLFNEHFIVEKFALLGAYVIFVLRVLWILFFMKWPNFFPAIFVY